VDIWAMTRSRSI